MLTEAEARPAQPLSDDKSRDHAVGASCKPSYTLRGRHLLVLETDIPSEFQETATSDENPGCSSRRYARRKSNSPRTRSMLRHSESGPSQRNPINRLLQFKSKGSISVRKNAAFAGS
jgi:hypothetical protein